VTRFEPLVKDSLYKRIVDQIRDLMLLGQLCPGDQLPTETEMTIQFGVSRTVVREAVKALGAQGLVQAIPGKGTFVAQPASEDIINELQLMLSLEDHSLEDLLTIRRILEIPTARLAAENACPATLEALKWDLEQMRQALGGGAEGEGDLDQDAFVRWDSAFHTDLVRATQNTVLKIYLQPVMLMLQAAREVLTRVPDAAWRAFGCHERIYRAVKDGDGDGAEAAMQEHLSQVSSDIELARGCGMLDRAGVPNTVSGND
jgi:GntR family transcriptional repressor for pyruvate dehydrogenase complex